MSGADRKAILARTTSRAVKRVLREYLAAETDAARYVETMRKAEAKCAGFREVALARLKGPMLVALKGQLKGGQTAELNAILESKPFPALDAIRSEPS